MINWKAAPVWARYNAKDRDGRVFWHEFKPSAGASSWLNKGGMSLAWNTECVDEEWRNCLEEKP